MMRATPAATLTVLYWALCLCTQKAICSASGVFELELDLFRNDRGLNADGNCCNGLRRHGNNCSSTCRTFFWICLTHFQRNLPVKPQCNFGSNSSQVLGDNNIVFGSGGPGFLNPIRFPFQFRWPGAFSLVIEAWHDSTLSGPTEGSPRELIYRLIESREANPSLSWERFTYDSGTAELRYSYRVTCAEHYYGTTCSNFCRPRNDQFGHFTCDVNGAKACRVGWKGRYCDQADCLPGCHPDNGMCDKPNECQCRLGWGGRFCNKCKTHPQCLHGTCGKPWDCICEEGWGGTLCNQDLNYCTNNRPCMNSGTCFNTGHGSYTCKCPAGYTGKRCEMVLDYCARVPCKHGATCQEKASGFICTCPFGYHGPNCESTGPTCSGNHCLNGGTCLVQNGIETCVCPRDYSGPICQHEVDRCIPSPCQNAATCVSAVGSYHCICRPGFHGTHCENNDNDCAPNPCLNGGTCTDGVNDFMCRCVPGFVGQFCETNVDDCTMWPCANGGTCHDLVNDFRCTCPPGFDGKDCHIKVNNCKGLPCQNNGTCYDEFDDFRCECAPGFWGTKCDYHVGSTPPPSTDNPLIGESSSTQNTDDATSSSSLLSGNEAELGGDDDLTVQQLVLIVCLGAGIPLVLIIVVVLVLLVRRRRTLRNNNNNNHDSNIQNEQNEQNMNNRHSKCVDSNIFTTIPQNTTSAAIKITNEDKYNTINNKHLYREKSTNKQFIKDYEQYCHGDYRPPKIPDMPDETNYDNSSDIRLPGKHLNTGDSDGGGSVRLHHQDEATSSCSVLVLDRPQRHSFYIQHHRPPPLPTTALATEV